MQKILLGLQTNNSQKAQSSIEFSLAFVITLLFLVLTCRLFVWFGGSMIRRQLAYEDSRTEAGSTSPGKQNFYSNKRLDLFSEEIFE